ncbi:WEB family protein At1g12150 [Malania oleifera]|uniref:WEB family protein At1g12150 n=1 Tax=Malania oleifera TaxID=397392 RepID=UPI0025AE05B0|nr:WEB family protein At1g12150 [Malania oleifera]
MEGTGIKGHPDQGPGSPRAEVGEIDTRAPFQSVKAAVSLFGAMRRMKPQTKTSKSSAERVLDKETQLHLAEKKRTKLKEQLKNAENTKGRAHFDLEKAKRTLQDLTNKLKAVMDSKKSAVEATEAAKARAKQLEEAHSLKPPGSRNTWREELDHERDQYRTASNELAIVKQELRKIQQDFDSFLEAKIVGFQQAADAQHALKINRKKMSELAKDIAAMQESLNHVKLATQQAKEEQAKIMTERSEHQKSHKAAIEETEMKLACSKSEFDPELATDLEEKLVEATREIEILQEEIKIARASSLDSVRILSLELDDAKKVLQKVTEDESSLRGVVDWLKQELENAKRDCFKLKEKEAVRESVTGSLHEEVEKSKTELETALAEEDKVGEASNEMRSTLQQLSSESQDTRQEVEEISKSIEDLKTEAERMRNAANEAEEKLQVAVEEAQEAREAEEDALDQIKMKVLYEKSAYGAPTPVDLPDGAGAIINLSAEEFESLSRKAEESEELADVKVAAAVAEMEAIKSREREAAEKLEGRMKEIDDIKSETKEAVKKAEMAEAAKMAVEGELKRRRQEEEEQKKAFHSITTASHDLELP